MNKHGKKIEFTKRGLTQNLATGCCNTLKVHFGVQGREQISFKEPKIMSPALKDNTSPGVRWHLSRRQTYRFSTVTYQHNSKHRQTSTTANKDKFLNLSCTRKGLLHRHTIDSNHTSRLFTSNLCRTLCYSPAALPL